MGDSEASLLPGERLLWTGRPARGRVISTDLALPGLLLVVLLVTAAVFIGRSSSHGSGTAPGGVGEFAVSMALTLAGLIAATVWALRTKPDELRRTVYQITDRRLLITTGAGRAACGVHPRRARSLPGAARASGRGGGPPGDKHGPRADAARHARRLAG